jgi:Divergent InlB B-repeat domain
VIGAAGNKLFYYSHVPELSQTQLRAIHFVPSVTLDAVVVPIGGGTVAGSGPYAPGGTASLSATSNPTHVFTHWTGEGIADPLAETTTVKIEADMSVTAHFAAVPSPLEWAAGFGLIGAAAEETANPAGDGVPNLLKFAVNIDPTRPDARIMLPGGTSGLPLVSMIAIGPQRLITFEFVRRRGSGLIYSTEISTDLCEWQAVNPGETNTRIDPFWERVTTYYELIGPEYSSVFGRVRVTSSN